MLHFLFCICFWNLLVIFMFCKAILGFRQGVNYLKRLHQIPCYKCVYFTRDYRLKCPVNPIVALSEEAINCRDFQAKYNDKFNNCQTSKTLTGSKF